MGETMKPWGAYANMKNPEGILNSQNDKLWIFSQTDLLQWRLQMTHSELD